MGKLTWKCLHIRYAHTAISTRTKEKGTRIIVVTATPACSGFHTPNVAEQKPLRQNYTKKSATCKPVIKVRHDSLWFAMVYYRSLVECWERTMQVVLLSSACVYIYTWWVRVKVCVMMFTSLPRPG